MEKFIKNWWPLLLIAGWWLWKRSQKTKQQNNTPTGAHFATTEELLEKNGFFKIGQKCPICGSEMYAKICSNPSDIALGTESAYLVRCCSNPSCENYCLK